jgi:hypothetical protein
MQMHDHYHHKDVFTHTRLVANAYTYRWVSPRAQDEYGVQVSTRVYRTPAHHHRRGCVLFDEHH